jgi:hypothetical protein
VMIRQKYALVGDNSAKTRMVSAASTAQPNIPDDRSDRIPDSPCTIFYLKKCRSAVQDRSRNRPWILRADGICSCEHAGNQRHTPTCAITTTNDTAIIVHVINSNSAASSWQMKVLLCARNCRKATRGTWGPCRKAL